VEINHTHGWFGQPFIAHTLAETRGNGWQGPRDQRGVRSATMADGNPNGYYLFSFEGNKVKPRFIPAGVDVKDRLRIMLDPPLIDPDSTNNNSRLGLDRGVQVENMFLVVNFFDAGERGKVTISLDGKAHEPLEYTERTDPFYVSQYDKYKGTEDALPPSAISSHIWQFPLPVLKPGLHSAVIIATDEFGFEEQKSFTFEIAKQQKP
jgi:hypothetical protein